jgi:hypothetical protein
LPIAEEFFWLSCRFALDNLVTAVKLTLTDVILGLAQLPYRVRGMTMKSRVSVSLCVGALLIVVMATVASAGSVTYTATPLGLQNTDWILGAPGTNLVVPQWNPASFPGATLTGVDVWVQGNLSADYRIENLSTEATSQYRFSQEANMTIQGPGSSIALNPVPIALSPGWPSYVSTPLSVFDGTQDYLGTDSASYLGSTANDVDTGSVSNSFWAAWYIGTGNVTFQTAASGFTGVFTNGGAPTDSKSISAGAQFSITYTFSDTIPEPAIASLLGLGGLGFLRRRRS